MGSLAVSQLDGEAFTDSLDSTLIQAKSMQLQPLERRGKMNGGILSQQVDMLSGSGSGVKAPKWAASRPGTLVASGRMVGQMRPDTSSSGGAEEVWKQIRTQCRGRVETEVSLQWMAKRRRMGSFLVFIHVA